MTGFTPHGAPQHYIAAACLSQPDGSGAVSFGTGCPRQRIHYRAVDLCPPCRRCRTLGRDHHLAAAAPADGQRDPNGDRAHAAALRSAWLRGSVPKPIGAIEPRAMPASPATGQE
jgi:hypothetical protein